MDRTPGAERRHYVLALAALSAVAWLGPCLWTALTQASGYTDIVLPAISGNAMAWSIFGLVSTIFLVIALLDQYLIASLFRQFDKGSVPYYETRYFYYGFSTSLTLYFCLTIYFFSANILELNMITSKLTPWMYVFGGFAILVIAYLGLKYFRGLRFWHAFFKAAAAQNTVQTK